MRARCKSSLLYGGQNIRRTSPIFCGHESYTSLYFAPFPSLKIDGAFINMLFYWMILSSEGAKNVAWANFGRKL